MPQLPGPQVCTDGCCPCSSHLCRQSLGLQSYLAWDSCNAWQCKCSSHALLRGTSHGAGTYRLRHFGDYKHIFGGPVAFNGTSSSFEVCTPIGLLLPASAPLLDQLQQQNLCLAPPKAAELWEAVCCAFEHLVCCRCTAWMSSHDRTSTTTATTVGSSGCLTGSCM